MANKVVFTSINPVRANMVTATSRYANSDVLYYGEENKITFSTYKKQTSENPKDKVMVIPGGMQYRPDLVSRMAYGTVDFWWKIMELNDINDVYNFTAGKTIRIPANPF